MSQNIETLGILEQNLSSLVMQRQTLQKQLLDSEQAITELETADTAYHIVGTVMIKKPANELKKDLLSKNETLSLKITTLQKQEDMLRKQVQELQASIMKEMNKGE